MDHSRPFRGYIYQWKLVPASAGMGFAIEGKQGDSCVLTGAVHSWHQDGPNAIEIETLNWRYTLTGGPA